MVSSWSCDEGGGNNVKSVEKIVCLGKTLKVNKIG
jgi:hypothetical protein